MRRITAYYTRLVLMSRLLVRDEWLMLGRTFYAAEQPLSSASARHGTGAHGALLLTPASTSVEPPVRPRGQRRLVVRCRMLEEPEVRAGVVVDR